MNRCISWIPASLFLALFLCLAGPGLANHPVLVEGESDFDGDGLLGAAEDTDGDRIFGTITAALGPDNGAANQNGRVLIVTSGRFPESILITGANGNVTLEAAPGVDANIDAVLAGLAGNDTRQNRPGIVVDAASNRNIIIRNIVSRNWTEGIKVMGSSRVLIENCRVDQNINYGIRAIGRAAVTIVNSSVSGTGFRVGAAGNAPSVDTPEPGIGISFEDSARGAVSFTTVSSSFRGGLINTSGANVSVRGNTLFDNRPDSQGRIKSQKR